MARETTGRDSHGQDLGVGPGGRRSVVVRWSVGNSLIGLLLVGLVHAQASGGGTVSQACPTKPGTIQIIACPNVATDIGNVTQTRTGVCDSSTGYTWVMGSWTTTATNCSPRPTTPQLSPPGIGDAEKRAQISAAGFPNGHPINPPVRIDDSVGGINVAVSYCNSIPSAVQNISCAAAIGTPAFGVVAGRTVGTVSYTTETAACKANVGAVLTTDGATACTVPVCTSVPSAAVTTTCATVAGNPAYGVPAWATTGMVTYTTETAACTGNVGAVLSSNGPTSCTAVCAGGATSWSVGANVCAGTLPATANGASAVVATTTPGSAGSATYTCSAGVWGAATAKTCVPSCSSSPSAAQTRSCASVAGNAAYGVPAANTVGTVTYTTETAACTGNTGAILTSNGASACTAPVVIPAPTVSVTRTPNSGPAGTAYTLTWGTTNATTLTWACSGPFTGTGLAPSLSGSTGGNYLAGWLGTTGCVWTATGPGGTATVAESFTVTAADCAAQNVSWTVLGNSCSATAPFTGNAGTTGLLSNTGNTNLGQANFMCSNGSFIAFGPPTCSPTVVLGVCPLTLRTWGAGVQIPLADGNPPMLLPNGHQWCFYSGVVGGDRWSAAYDREQRSAVTFWPQYSEVPSGPIPGGTAAVDWSFNLGGYLGDYVSYSIGGSKCAPAGSYQHAWYASDCRSAGNTNLDFVGYPRGAFCQYQSASPGVTSGVITVAVLELSGNWAGNSRWSEPGNSMKNGRYGCRPGDTTYQPVFVFEGGGG